MGVFDALFESGRAAILNGAHETDTPPVDGGARWGLSVCFRPRPPLAARLDEITREALTFAGPGHWATGAPVSSHFTVRTLGPHRTPLAPDDPVVLRAARALRGAAATGGPARLAVTGLTLTPASVMAAVAVLDGPAEEFRAGLAEALGDDGWFEAGFRREIWHVNLVHFGAPIADPAGLVDWVADRRRLDLGETEVTGAELLRWEYDGAQVVPVPIETVMLG